ncbi:MAG: response regulator [Acidobacteria bacterium]|nr:response regulator [Acidobacteriota bacterium]
MYTIAIVDDVEDSRDLLYYLLRHEYRVTRYATGEEALEDFERSSPDLVIMDISLRGIDGLEVLSRIRQNVALRNIPVVAVTAHAMSGDREKCLSAGFTEYVSKPIIDMAAFKDRLNRLLPPTGKVG